jgi:hypothetical protein
VRIELEIGIMVLRVAPQQVIDLRRDYDQRAEYERDEKSFEPLSRVLGSRPAIEREPRGCSRDEEKERHVPLGYECDEHRHRETPFFVFDVVLSRTEDDSAVEIDEQQDREHSEPVYIVTPFGIAVHFAPL